MLRVLATYLMFTLHTDGRAEYSLEGASRFPRHWIYDADGRYAQVRLDRLRRPGAGVVRPPYPMR